jgi:hypothetical protein
MSDGDNQQDPPVGHAEGGVALSEETRAPGWYSRGRNPNEQSYWDGEGYSETRVWVGGRGWVEGAAAPSASSIGPTAGSQPTSGVETAPVRRAKVSYGNFSLGGLGLIVVGIALMYGSVSSWITTTVSLGTHSVSASVNGTDPSIVSLIHTNGWITFIAGTVILVFGGLLLLSEDGLFAALALLASLAAVGVSSYDLIRIQEKVSGHSGAGIGAGLVCVMAASVLALIISAVRVVKAQ